MASAEGGFNLKPEQSTLIGGKIIIGKLRGRKTNKHKHRDTVRNTEMQK